MISCYESYFTVKVPLLSQWKPLSKVLLHGPTSLCSPQFDSYDAEIAFNLWLLRNIKRKSLHTVSDGLPTCNWRPGCWPWPSWVSMDRVLLLWFSLDEWNLWNYPRYRFPSNSFRDDCSGFFYFILPIIIWGHPMRGIITCELSYLAVYKDGDFKNQCFNRDRPKLYVTGIARPKCEVLVAIGEEMKTAEIINTSPLSQLMLLCTMHVKWWFQWKIFTDLWSNNRHFKFISFTSWVFSNPGSSCSFRAERTHSTNIHLRIQDNLVKDGSTIAIISVTVHRVSEATLLTWETRLMCGEEVNWHCWAHVHRRWLSSAVTRKSIWCASITEFFAKHRRGR